MSTTLRIFGCSDNISNLKLPKLLSQHDSLGLNHFPFLGARTKYWLWLDNKDFDSCVYIENELAYKQYLKFIPNFEDADHKGLFGGHSVASFAVDFAIKEGYKRAELYGILDGNYNFLDNDHVEYKHFYNKRIHVMHKANLQSWKDEIMRYNDRIEVVIPYQTF